jgi:pimeloyl-ACP methyl ester carboxylesterase
MTKTFRNNAFFFLGLSSAMGIFHCILSIIAGADLVTQNTFSHYFLLANVVSSFATVFVLRSYHDQHFRAAFVTGCIAFCTAVLRAVMVYCIVVPLTRVFQPYYPLILTFDLAATLAAAGTLVFSRSGKNGWLKAAGALGFLLSCVSLGLLIWSAQMHEGRSTPALEKWQLCLSFFASLQPLLFIGYFGQLRAVESKSSESRQPNLIVTVGLPAVFLFLFFAVQLMGEGIRATRPQPQALVQAQSFKALTFKGQNGDALSYRFLTPEGYDSTKHYPLLLSLHGGAGYGTDNIKQLASWEIEKLTEPHNRKKYPVFIVAPQIMHGSAWGGVTRLVTRDTIVFDLLNALKTEYNIDPDRVYVAGHSLGGYGTWHFIETRPDEFAAAIPLSGAGDPALAKNMVNVPIWAFHGETDRNVPVEGSRDVINAIRQAGGKPKYTEFPEVGHYLNPSLNATPGILDWLFAQRRVHEPQRDGMK